VEGKWKNGLFPLLGRIEKLKKGEERWTSSILAQPLQFSEKGNE
jgi:hypothetical protein